MTVLPFFCCCEKRVRAHLRIVRTVRCLPPVYWLKDGLKVVRDDEFNPGSYAEGRISSLGEGSPAFQNSTHTSWTIPCLPSAIVGRVEELRTIERLYRSCTRHEGIKKTTYTNL